MTLRDPNESGAGKHTQADRVLKASRSHRGTCQHDWLAAVTPDGGPVISRVAARIHELEEKGCVFEFLHDRGGTRVYRLVSEPEQVAGVGAGRSCDGLPSDRRMDEAAPPSIGLFEVGKAEMSPYEYDLGGEAA